MNLPQDPFMLMSMVNMKLRDEYSDLASFCGAYGIPEEELKEKLAAVGMEYMPEINQFR